MRTSFPRSLYAIQLPSVIPRAEAEQALTDFEPLNDVGGRLLIASVLTALQTH